MLEIWNLVLFEFSFGKYVLQCQKYRKSAEISFFHKSQYFKAKIKPLPKAIV